MRDDDFERLYAAHAESLIGFLVYRTGDRALAEDMVADTFERVLRTRFRFDPRKSSEKTWIYTIALNLLRDHARRRGVAAKALERAPEPVRSGASTGLEFVEQRDELRRALEQLSVEEREAVALRYGADLTVPEISRITGEKCRPWKAASTALCESSGRSSTRPRSRPRSASQLACRR